MTETKERRCVTGADPFKRFPVPIEAEFEDAEYLDAPELAKVARALIDHCDELGALQAYPPSLNVVWKAKAKKKQGATVLGFCNKLSGLTKYYGECDWVIEVGADAIRELHFTNHQVEALLFHELNHIEPVVDDETGDVTWKVRGEDAYAFVTEIKRYGAWKSDLGSVADAWNQAPLFAPKRSETQTADDADSFMKDAVSRGRPAAIEATRVNIVTAPAD